MNEFTRFEAWPRQEIYDDLMLQFDLSAAKNEVIDIPFRIIEWCGCDGHSEYWNEKDTEIKVLMSGSIIFEGVRHCNFCEQDDGYMNYPDIKNLARCLDRIHELCLIYCSEYRIENYCDNKTCTHEWVSLFVIDEDNLRVLGGTGYKCLKCNRIVPDAWGRENDNQ